MIIVQWRQILDPFPYYTGLFFNFTGLAWPMELGPYMDSRHPACSDWFHEVGLHNEITNCIISR